MLTLSHAAYLSLVGHCLDGVPDEACGLLVGSLLNATAPQFVPCRNTAASARIYTLDPRDFMRAERAAEAIGRHIVGVVHSHTHTTNYPSVTDVAAAPDPAWHYVIVSLKDDAPSVRSYRIIDGHITEEMVAVIGR